MMEIYDLNICGWTHIVKSVGYDMYVRPSWFYYAHGVFSVALSEVVSYELLLVFRSTQIDLALLYLH